MDCFFVKLLCIKTCDVSLDYDETLHCEEGKSYRVIIGSEGVRFYHAKDKYYSLPFSISEIAEDFIINQPYSKREYEKYRKQAVFE